MQVLPGGTGLALHRINPENGRYLPPEAITGPGFGELGGNEGTVSAWDAVGGVLYVLGKPRGTQPGTGEPFNLVGIDVNAAEVLTHPKLGVYGHDVIFGLNDMAWAAKKKQKKTKNKKRKANQVE